MRGMLLGESDLFECIPDILIVADRHGRIVRANAAAREKLGYSSNELSTLSIQELHPSEKKEVIEKVLDKLASEDEETIALPLMRKDGVLLVAESRIRKTEFHGQTCFLMVSKDLATEIEASQRFERFFNNNPALMAVSSISDKKFVDVNQAFLNTLGYERQEVIGRTPSELDLFVLPRRHDETAEELEKTGRITDIELQVRRKDGTIIDGIFSGEIIYSQGKQYFLTVMIDITERKKMERENARLQEQLVQAQKLESLGRLAGGVAHDFNNMLSVILGNADLALKHSKEGDPDRQLFEEIGEAAQRAKETVKKLLAFARKETVTPRVFDMNKSLESMLRMLHNLIGENIELVWKPGERVGAIKMDPSQLDQILVNLCINAKDAIGFKNGKIVIKTGSAINDEGILKKHTEFVPEKYVWLSVSDNGCGMDPAVIGNIFEPFFTTKGPGMGTGLGLATVYGIVKQNYGFIDVHSEPGKGSTFKIYIPRYLGTYRTNADEHHTSHSNESGVKTILLVEDEPAVLKPVAAMLGHMGYTVLAASSPDEAIRMAESHQGIIDILITDVIMPEMNGKELSDKLLSSRPDMKVLFMSGYTANVIASHGIVESGVHFIQKPFTIDVLSKKIEEVLQTCHVRE